MDLTTRYCVVMGCYWSNFAVFSNYATVYLLGRGFSNTAIGMMTAAASLLAALLQPALGAWADRPRSPSVKNILLLLTGLFLVSAALVPLTADRSREMLVLSYGAGIMLMQCMMPLFNALGTLSNGNGRKVDFGIGRGAGSLVYAVFSVLIGQVTEKHGIQLIPLTGVGLYILLTLCLTAFPFKKTPVPQRKTRAGFFKRYPGFMTVLFAAGCLYTSHKLIGNFAYQVIVSKGGDSASLGVSYAIAALTELPVMFFFSKLLQKMSAGKWLILSGFANLLKCAGTLLVSSVAGYYGVQFLQLLAFAVITVASVHYVAGLMAPQDAVKGQAFFGVSSTAGTIAASALGGRLLDMSGVTALLIAAVLFAAVSAAVMVWGVRKCRAA